MDRHSDPQFKSDDGNALRIWKEAAQNNFLSQEHGRPIFDEVVFVEVISPGSGNSTPVFELVRYMDKLSNRAEPKYGAKYDEYKKFVKEFEAGEASDHSLAGTPLSQWSEVSRTMVASLRAQNIYTVEALANLPDGKLIVVGPDGRTWREKAAAYLENAEGNAVATRLAAALEEQKRENADLHGQIAALAGKLETMEAATGAAEFAKQLKPAEPVASII